MLSYWEKKNLIGYDLIVVGGGFVGLSTAIHYKEKFPGRSVTVLEKGLFPSGASTRNAGFACFGSLTEILDDLDHHTEEEVLDLIQKRWQGINSIRKEFGDKPLDYFPYGGYELIRNEEAYALDKIESVNRLLSPLIGDSVFSLVPSIRRFRFSHDVTHLVFNPWEGQLDPGKYIQCLWDKCRSLRIAVFTGVTVQKIEDSGEVKSKGPNGEEVVWEGGQVAICTNAFTKQLLPKVDLEPGRGVILLSQPMDQLPWKGCFHMDKGFVYFRNIDRRLLIGGGRNVALKEENTLQEGINPSVKAYLEDLVRKVVLPKQQVQWEMTWSGVMAFGKQKSPIVKMLNEQLGVAVRLGGMGVAIGWETGKELAAKLGY